MTKNRVPGSVTRQKNGSWRIVITLPRDADGTYPQRSAVLIGTRTEAEAKRLDMVERYLSTRAKRSMNADGKMTLGVLLDKWLIAREGHIAESTHYSYASYITRSIKPAIGDLTLEQLDVDELDDFYSVLRREGKRPATIHQTHAIIRGALGWGMKRRYVTQNVAVLADLPPKETPALDLPTVVEVQRILAVADAHNPEFGLVVRLAAVTGARRGTLAGFRLSDVSFTDGTISVTRSITATPGHPVHAKGLKHGKGGAVPIDKPTLDRIATHVAYLHERARTCGIELGDDFYLFSTRPDCSTPVRPDSLSSQWATIRRRAGYPTLRLHDLRHFVSSHIVAQFDPVTAANRVMHSSPKMTLDVYGHVVDGRAREAGEYIGRLLGS